MELLIKAQERKLPPPMRAVPAVIEPGRPTGFRTGQWPKPVKREGRIIRGMGQSKPVTDGVS